MRKINNILVILFIAIFSIPNIGICGKIEFERDKQQREEKERIEKEKSVIGNTYTVELKSKFSLPLEFDSENKSYSEKIIIKENINLIVLDLVDYFYSGIKMGKIYKVILDPNGEKITAYIETHKFRELTEGYSGHKIILKSEISDEDRQKLISENEKQQEKKIAQQKKKKITKMKEIKAKKEAKKETNNKESCYQLGFRYGRCGAMALKGYQCDPADDIVMPVECRGSASDRGLHDGVKSVY